MIKNIYIKTEPAGEICAGKLDDKQVSLLRELYRKDSMKDSEFGISNEYNVAISKYSDLEKI